MRDICCRLTGLFGLSWMQESATPKTQVAKRTATVGEDEMNEYG